MVAPGYTQQLHDVHLPNQQVLLQNAPVTPRLGGSVKCYITIKLLSKNRHGYVGLQ